MDADRVSNPIILGCGYLGKYLTKQLLSTDHSPTCVVQSQANHSQLKASGLKAVIYDLDLPQPENAELELSTNQIYYLAPPSNRDDKDHRINQHRCKTKLHEVRIEMHTVHEQLHATFAKSVKYKS